jgi:hypothetical protein
MLITFFLLHIPSTLALDIYFLFLVAFICKICSHLLIWTLSIREIIFLVQLIIYIMFIFSMFLLITSTKNILLPYIFFTINIDHFLIKFLNLNDLISKFQFLQCNYFFHFNTIKSYLLKPLIHYKIIFFFTHAPPTHL